MAHHVSSTARASVEPRAASTGTRNTIAVSHAAHVVAATTRRSARGGRLEQLDHDRDRVWPARARVTLNRTPRTEVASGWP